MEIGRRQLHASWDKLRHARRDEDDRRPRRWWTWPTGRRPSIAGRRWALVEAERTLGEEIRHWQEVRQELEKENEGLENRIRNYRHKIYDQEEELKRLDGLLAGLQAKAEASTAAILSATTEPRAEGQTEAAAAEPKPQVPVALPVLPLSRKLAELAAPSPARGARLSRNAWS